jgi:hypothetical protein
MMPVAMVVLPTPLRTPAMTMVEANLVSPGPVTAFCALWLTDT